MPVVKNTVDIVEELRRIHNPDGTSGSSTDLQPVGAQSYSDAAYQSITAPTIKFEDFDVDPRAIYTQLHDGSYVAKYENFLGQTGNEDRLARQQSANEQIFHGINKAAAKTFGYAFDSVVGTAIGVVQGIANGDMRYVWDNDFAHMMDDYNTKLDNNLPNYYTDEQKSAGFLESLGTANFWANDFMGGIAFVGGALIPDLLLGVATGGATVGGSLAKFSLKLGAKKLFKKGVKEVGERTIGGANFLRGVEKANFIKSGGDLLKTGTFLVRTSNFEAGMEARHNLHTAVDNFYGSFEELNGRPPSAEEAKEFMGKAVTSANYVYGVNMAILSVSNAVMFGKTFNIGTQTAKRLNNFGNRLIGLNVKGGIGTKAVLTQASKRSKILGNGYFILGKPAVEGLYEEGLQGVAGKTMQNYLAAQYNPDQEDTIGMWASLSEAFHDQYTTKEGWKEIGLGMLIGFMGGSLTGQLPAGFGKGSYSSVRKTKEAQVDVLNNGTADLMRRAKASTAQANIGRVIEQEQSENRSTDALDAVFQVQFIKSHESIKSHGQITEGFEAVIDGMDISDEQAEVLGGTEGVREYKSALKEQFSTTLKDYKFATRTVESLGLENIKDSKGNTQQIADALVMNIVAGKAGLVAAKDIGTQIDDLLGESGSFGLLEHYNNLSKEKKTKAQGLRRKKRALRDLEKQAVRNAQEVAGINTGGRKFSPEVRQKRYERASEKLVRTNQKVAELNQEIADITEEFDNDLRGQNLTLDREDSIESVGGIIESLDRIDRIQDFANSLERNGRQADAQILTNLLEQYKLNADSHNEMTTGFQRMLATDFFSGKEGKGLRKMILGKEYVMSEDFRKIIKENEAKIDESLRLTGFRGEGTVMEQIESQFESQDLSDREKFRMESIIRIQLGYGKLVQELENIQDESPIITSQKSTGENPLEGDTVALIQRINPEGKDLTSLDVINDILTKVGKEIDSVRDINKNPELVKGLEDKLEQAKAQEVEQEAEAGDHKKARQLVDKITKGEQIESAEDLQIQENYPKFIERELTIKKLTSEITSSKGEIIPILKSADYKRMNSLIKKREITDLTEEEVFELEDLEVTLDQWTDLTGTVIEGLRMSDLVRQKIVLEETPITEVENVGATTTSETLSQISFTDSPRTARYSYGQTYHGVTAIKTEDAVEISGITPEGLLDQIGFAVPITINDQGNTIIKDEDVETINKNSPISILATNESLPSNYSVVLKTDELSTKALTTDFSEDFGTQMSPDAIYDAVKGDDLVLEVSPEDGWNRERKGEAGFIEAYKNARNKPRKLKKLREEMRRSLVIRVKDKQGNILAVLKGIRPTAINSIDAAKFDSIRNEIANNDQLLDELVDVGIDQQLDITGVKVKKVLVGHPNLNFVKEGATVSVESKQIATEDISSIKDIGYISQGKIFTQSKEQGIDTTFITNKKKDSTNTKHPFIVIQKGATRIAYPVTVVTQEAPDNSKFSAVYNNPNFTPADKAAELNKFMALRGIDIKESGNSFAAYGKTNLNDKFFGEKLAQLGAIDYFNSLDSWIDPSVSIETIIKSGVTTDLNLKDPLHSPKVQMDFTEVNTTISEVVQSEEVEDNIKKKTAGKGVSDLINFIKKPC